jgi:hypothetical protein
VQLVEVDDSKLLEGAWSDVKGELRVVLERGEFMKDYDDLGEMDCYCVVDLMR